MVLAHTELLQPKPTQRELARQRIAGTHPTPLPGPGVYARHDAVDMPALLPDGSPSPLSVSPVIARERAGRGEQPRLEAGAGGPGGQPAADERARDAGDEAQGTAAPEGGEAAAVSGAPPRQERQP
jgi:NADH-quinone oxidoreductase subunit J